MTLANLQSDISSALGMTVSATSRITTTETLRWLNEDYRAAQSALADANINYYQGETTEFDTEDGVDTYALTNFLKMKRVEIQYDDAVDKVRARPIDINDIHSDLNPDSEPWSQLAPFYDIWEDDLIIKPTPDEDSADWDTDAGKAVKIWFIEMQDDLSSDTDVPVLPTAFQHILAYGPIARGFRKLRKFTEAREYETLKKAGFEQMVAENAYKDKTKPIGFTITRGGSRKNGIWRP